MGNVIFDLFRYQLVPKNRNFQLELFEGITSLDDLLNKKNLFFAESLEALNLKKIGRSNIRTKLIYSDNESYLFKFAAKRNLKIEREDFTDDELLTWPDFYVFIWNNKDQQIIAIQERYNAFRETESPAKSIIESLNTFLGKKNLRAYIETIFLENAFWDILENNEGKIRDINFELITPNMSNISHVLSDGLKDLATKTNTAKTDLRINADPDSSIMINKNNLQIKNLVQYSSEGGGSISIKIRGVSKRIQTKKSKRTIDIDEIKIDGHDGHQVANILKGLIEDGNN